MTSAARLTRRSGSILVNTFFAESEFFYFRIQLAVFRRARAPHKESRRLCASAERREPEKNYIFESTHQYILR